jgi:hypothetical protein
MAAPSQTLDRVLPASGEVMVQIWYLQRPPGAPYRPPANDTRFPFAPGDVLAPAHRVAPGGWASGFRGDGLEFGIWVRVGDNAPVLTASQEEIVRRMIASIRFQPWAAGETRNGWTAFDFTGPDSGWVTLDGATYVAFVDANGAVWLYGPVPSCGASDTTAKDANGNAVLTCPDGSSMAWDTNGQPVPTGPGAATNAPLDRHPVVIAHDGSFIAELGTTIS